MQVLAELTDTVGMLKQAPKSPFLLSSMYPAFAGFAAFYGQPTDATRYNALHKLVSGTALADLVSLNDRAFLFFTFLNLCANVSHESGTGCGAWYFSPKVSATLKIIRKWMSIEDKDEDSQEKATNAVQQHFEPISDLLPSYMDGETVADDDVASDSDSD